MNIITKIVLINFVLLMQSALADTNEFLIKNGDRVVIYGDSITDNQLYPLIIEDYVVTRWPQWNVKFWNRGWGGDTAHYYGRFQRDCLALKPTVVFICLGMNDALYKPFDQNLFTNYVRHLDKMSKDLAVINASLVLISPPTYDITLGPTLKNPEDLKTYDMSGYPEVLREFSLGMLSVATIDHCRYVDLNREYAELLATGKAKYGNSFKLTGENDPVHPKGPGQLAMAAIILKNLNAPSSIATLAIDAGKGSVINSKGTKVSTITIDSNELNFVRIDEALPSPMYDGTEPADTMLGVSERLNANIIKFEHLTPGMHRLSIDNSGIVTKSADEWFVGVNLSSFSYTPEMKQSQDVAQLTRQINDLEYNKWRKILCKKIVWVGDSSSYDVSDVNALKNADKQIADLIVKRKTIAQPKPHRYFLSRME